MKNITRFVWISNLPTSVSEDELRGVLNCYGKIQCLRFVNDGAIVTFVDSRSASKAIESGVKLHKTSLKLQYCESADTLLSEQKSDQRSDSVSDSKSVAGEIDTESTSSSCSSRSSSSRFMNNKKSYSPNKRDHRRSNGELDDHSSKSGNNQKEDGLRGLKITHLSLRSSDSNLREGLFHEYKKHGKITSLVIRGSGSSRYAHITFKLCEDAEKAYEHSKDKVFFGVSVQAELVEGLDIEDPDLCPPEHALDEYHPKATKTLFVGNLCSATITQDELMRVFRDYGEIIEIDIKMQTNQPGTSYAFVQFTDIKSVVRALSDQERVTVDGKSVKLGFGKSQPCSVVWLDNLSPNVTENFLSRQFGRYGRLKDIVLDMKLGRALLYFDAAEVAQRALNETRNRSLLGKKVQIDFASVECQVAFIEKSQPRESLFGKYGDRWRELLEACIPCGGGGLAGYLEESRGLQKLRHKEIVALLGLSNSSSRLNKSYGYSRSSHHGISRNVSPSRGSVYSRNSPARDFNNLSGSSFRGSGGGSGLLSSLIGLPSYKHESSSRDRSKYSQSRKTMAPTSYDCSRGISNGGGSYQHSVGYNSVEISPHRQMSSWNSSRKSQYAASTCSDSSSVERKPESLKRDASHSHKHISEHQRTSSKRKSSHRANLERHRHSRDDPTSPQLVSSSRRYLRESTGSTPESNQHSKSFMDATNGESRIPSSKHKTKLPEPKTPLTSESSGDTLSKLHRERYELLMKLNQLSTKKKTDAESSTQHGYGGMDSTTNGPTLLLESDPIQVPTKRIDGGSDFPVSGSVGSAGQSSSSDPGDAIFSPNSSLVPPDRMSSPMITTHPALPSLPPPPPPPPPPLTNRLSSGVVPSPGVPNHSPNQAAFESIPPPPVSPSQPKAGTSFDGETLTRNSPTFQLSLPPFSSYSTSKQPLDSDSEQTGLESYLTSTSIDERIRQLDEQFKIRPHVDYSRFRIRRRSDIPATNTGGSSSIHSVASSVVDVKKSPFHLLPLSSPDATTLGTSETRSANAPRRTDTSEFIKSMLSSTCRSLKTSTIIEPSITNHPSLPPIPPLSAPVSLLDKTLLSPITAAPSVRVDLKPSTPRSLLSPINSATSTQSIPSSSCKLPEKIKPALRKEILHSEKTSPPVQTVKTNTPEVLSPPSSNRPPLPDGPHIGVKRKPNTSIASHISPKSPKLSMSTKSSSVNEEVVKSNGVSSPPPPSKPSERSTSPLKSRKAREGQPTQQTRRQLISPPTTPFERNKLHFKKLPKKEKDTSREQRSTPSSAPPLKSIRSPPQNGSENRSKGGEESSVRSKKKLRRKRQESDEDDWKPHGGSGSVSSEFLKADDLTDGGGHYETMYDKIKRRGNKYASSERLESKPEALKSLLKSRKHKVGKGDDLESQSTKPPHLTPEALETSSRRSSKKSRLKRPDSEGGSSSDSDSPQMLPSAKRRRFTPVSRKRRVSEETAATTTKSKTAVTKKRVRNAATVYSSNESANESDSNGRAFFPESRRRRSRRSNSSSTTSTPQISRSCSPVESVEKSDHKEDEEHLPLLEKQITSDHEDIEEMTLLVEQEEGEKEQPLCDNVKSVIPDVEPKVRVAEAQEEREIEVELTEEVVMTEEPRQELEIPVFKSLSSSKSCGGSDLIFTSPLVKPTSTNTTTTNDTVFNEEFGLALLSSAATVEAEAAITKKSEVHAEVKTSPLSSVQQPVTLLTPGSVIPASSTNQRIALVVNNLGPNSTDVSSQPTFVLAPSSFSLVSGSQQSTQLIINSTAATPLIQQIPVVDNKPPPEVVPVKSSDVSDYVQHFIEQARGEIAHSSSSQEENGRRSGVRKSTTHQKAPSRSLSSEIKTQFVPSTSATAGTGSVDPYEPNFDEPESEVILPPARKDTVTEVINSVIHGEFKQNDYVQRLSSGSRLSSGPSSSSLPAIPKDIKQETSKTEIYSLLSSTPGDSSMTATPNDIKLEVSKADIYSHLSSAPNSSIVTTISKDVKLEPPNIDVYSTTSGQSEVLTTSQNISAPNSVAEVSQLAGFSDDRSSVLISRGGGVQSPIGNIIMKKPAVPQVHHQQHIHSQTLIESSQHQIDDHRPPPPQSFLNPLQVLTLMTPSLPPTSGESAVAVVAQQISPQVQPQLQDIAASFLLSILERQAQQQQQRQSEPSFLDTASTHLHSAVPPQNSDLPVHNRYASLNENYLLLEPRFLENKFSLLWRGCMSLKNDRVSVRMLYLAGNQDLILSCLNVLTGGEDPSGVPVVLRIAQRMRLESTQLEGVQRKLREPSNYCMCLALASSSSMHNLVAERNDMMQQIISLQNMISYLQEKTAAGIISCPSGHEVKFYKNPYVMHMFPPCDFTTSQLRFLSTDLQQTLLHAGLPYMLIIVV
ncbi:unnamed protein product [Hymenolepis diminuta]|uniref:RRM domain-containing protein n=1 Tax=Hymenolepis diminuta TaxID=6216 RepID=A0A0R3SGS0_HYMDI|nr:unnamed protein product [Hymenolepis diminuta]